jgi:uncharacterized protein involved in propanediol utilization
MTSHLAERSSRRTMKAAPPEELADRVVCRGETPSPEDAATLRPLHSAEAENGASGAHGIGRAFGHHGELLQGVFERDGRLCRGLVTLPTATFRSVAEVEVGGDRSAVWPVWKRKSLSAARCALGYLDSPSTHVRVWVESETPVRRGLGSSTSDVVAVVRAVADALRRRITPAEVAALAVDAETASDSTMYSRAVLFAHRDGVLHLAWHLVSFRCREGNGIDTLSLEPARYCASELRQLRKLRALLKRGLLERDHELVGAVATASALLNQRHLPIPRFGAFCKIVKRTQAVGIQVSHSGNVAALIFGPCSEHAIADAEAQLRKCGATEITHLLAGDAEGADDA